MAKTDKLVIRMPQQHVREGRGTPGYKSTDEATVQVYETDAPASFGRRSTSSTGRKNKDAMIAEAEAAGIELTGDETIAELKAKIAGEVA